MTKYTIGMKGYNPELSQKIMESWNVGKVTLDFIYFLVMSRSVSSISRLSMEGVNIQKNTKMYFKEALENLLDLGENISRLHSKFNREVIEGVWKNMVKVLIQFITY